MKFIRAIGGRKFFIVQEVLILSFIGLLLGKISDTVWATIVGVLVGVYAGANVYQKIKVKVSKNNERIQNN